MDLSTAAASPATGAMPLPRPLEAALKHHVSPSRVHVQMRLKERTAVGACSLRLRCSLTTSSEKQLTGAPGVEVEEEGEPTDYERSLDGVDLRSHDACRAAVHKLLSEIPGAVSLLDPAAGEWYEPVLRAAADDIVSQLQQVTSGEQIRGHAFDVSLSIEETFRFVQPEALLLACEEAAILTSSRRSPEERCAVCMECLPLPATPDARPAVCMEEKAVPFTLPSCGHTFRRGCIAAWFQKGSTCPLCRCDMMYCLFDVEKQFGLQRNNENEMEEEAGGTG